MGQYFSTGTRASGTFTKSLSNDLTAKYVDYVNAIKLKDPDGNELTLTSTNAGTYYDYLKSIIEESLNNFISDTSFPYTPSSGGQGGPGGQGGGSHPNGSIFPASGSVCLPSGSRSFPSSSMSPPSSSSKRNLETSYETAADYISSLNSDKEWITYDSSSKKYKITSVVDFLTHCKSASKDVGAFDNLKKSQAENLLFGYSSTDYTKHFDKIMAGLLTDKSSIYSSLTNWDSSYPTDYTNDLSATDTIGNTIESRLNMYNPMYYLLSYYDGYGSSDVADYFRINTGITQGDTSSVVEMNLYLALLNYGKNVEFTTVWNQGHTEAERSGDAEDNFISWIAKIEGASDSSSSSTTSSTTSTTTSTTTTNDNDDDDDDIENIETNSNLVKLNRLLIYLLLFLL